MFSSNAIAINLQPGDQHDGTTSSGTETNGHFSENGHLFFNVP